MIFSSLVYFGEKEFRVYETFILNTTIYDRTNNTWTFVGIILNIYICKKNIHKLILDYK